MQGINKQTMLDLIIDAKRNEPEDVCFSDWLAEYLADRLSTLIVAGGCYCRECEKATRGGAGYVWCGKKAMPLNGFCSEGKRKEAAHEVSES